MNQVDKHSTTCFKDEPSYRESMQNYEDGRRHTTLTADEDLEYRQQSDELNERIFKLI